MDIKISVLCIVLLTVFLSGHSYAGTWRDAFDGDELNGWERIVEENPWFADWGITRERLVGTIENHGQVQATAADFLHWNVHQFELNRLTVVGEEMRYDRHVEDISGELCLFLGKRVPNPGFSEGYIFSPENITKIQFSTKGVFKKDEVIANYGLMFRLTSGDLRVVFNAGEFRLFTQDLLITEFFDDKISKIDVVGLIIMHKFPGAWFLGTISTFSISGSGIPNHNPLDVQLQDTQLTTTWGELKRF